MSTTSSSMQWEAEALVELAHSAVPGMEAGDHLLREVHQVKAEAAYEWRHK